MELNSHLFGVLDKAEQRKALIYLGELRDMKENAEKTAFMAALVAVTKKERKLRDCLSEAYTYRETFNENTMGWRMADALCEKMENED